MVTYLARCSYRCIFVIGYVVIICVLGSRINSDVFLISIWGLGATQYSAMKFLIFTLTSGAFFLIGILSVYFATGTFVMYDITELNLVGVASSTFNILIPSILIFLIFFIGLIKLPLFPLHSWLPDAHTGTNCSQYYACWCAFKVEFMDYSRINVDLFNSIDPSILFDLSPYIALIGAVKLLSTAAVLTIRPRQISKINCF